MNSLRCHSQLAALGVLIFANVSVTLPQTPRAVLRDPTQPPAAFAAPAGSARLPADTFRPEHLVTVAGVRYLVWNSRRYAVGEMLQGARIERISETEIWLRGGDGLRKLPLFAGIEKRPPNSTPPAVKPTRAAMDGKNGLIK